MSKDNPQRKALCFIVTFVFVCIVHFFDTKEGEQDSQLETK